MQRIWEWPRRFLRCARDDARVQHGRFPGVGKGLTTKKNSNRSPAAAPCRTSVGKSVNCGRSPGLSFTHLSASMAVVGVRPELKQATEARSAARTCARWLAGRLPAASSIGLELDSTKSTCSPSVSSSRRLLPMVIRPGIGWVKLRRGVDTASRRDTGHAAAPPAGPAVHPVGLSQLRRWPIRPSGAP